MHIVKINIKAGNIVKIRGCGGRGKMGEMRKKAFCWQAYNFRENEEWRCGSALCKKNIRYWAYVSRLLCELETPTGDRAVHTIRLHRAGVSIFILSAVLKASCVIGDIFFEVAIDYFKGLGVYI